MIETCRNCNEFGNLEVIEETTYDDAPTEYKCQCPNCLVVDVYQEDLDDFYQGMNDMRPMIEEE